MGSVIRLASPGGAFQHSADSSLPLVVLGYGESQQLLSREGPHLRRARETYDLLLETMGQPRIDPDRRDLFRFPRLDLLLEKVLSSGRRSPMSDETLRAEFLEELDTLRELGILEIVPVLMVNQQRLVCNEYILFQSRNETGQQPIKGYIETAILESTREATNWLKNFYHIDLNRVAGELEAENPHYILYLPYYHIMNAYRTAYEEILRLRMAAAKNLPERAFLTIHDRYGIHFLQHVYHRLTGSALHGGNPLTIDPAAKSLARHPYAWCVSSLTNHLRIFVLLQEAFRKKLTDFDSVFASTQNAEFRGAYKEYLAAKEPAPELTRRLISALFGVFGSSLHGADFAFFRNVALEIFDHTRTLADVSEEESARERDELILSWARQIADTGGWAIVEDLIEPRELERVPNYQDRLSESSRTGIHSIRAVSNRKRICTFALHESNLDAIQKESVRRAQRGNFEWLEPLQALYQMAMENLVRSTEAMHHAIAAYYRPNQELIYWNSLPFYTRLWRRFLLWVSRKKHPPLQNVELAQKRAMHRREERMEQIEKRLLKEKGRRMAHAALDGAASHPGASLPERRGSARARPGATLLRDLTAFWESDQWTIPVTRELPGLLGESLEKIKKKLGEEYHELHLRGNDRVLIPRSYLSKNRKRIIQRINAYFLKHVDARGEVLAAGLGPNEIKFLKKKVAFLENLRRALEETAT